MASEEEQDEHRLQLLRVERGVRSLRSEKRRQQVRMPGPAPLRDHVPQVDAEFSKGSVHLTGVREAVTNKSGDRVGPRADLGVVAIRYAEHRPYDEQRYMGGQLGDNVNLALFGCLIKQFSHAPLHHLPHFGDTTRREHTVGQTADARVVRRVESN